MVNNKDIREIHNVLKKELGEWFEEIIELEFDMSLSTFIKWFVEYDKDSGEYFVTI